MGDITNPRLLYLKGGLFVVLGLTASVLVFLERPSLKVALLLAIAIWAFARAYYFAFYVIEHYIDPHSRYAGLFDFFRRRGRPRGARNPDREGCDETQPSNDG